MPIDFVVCLNELTFPISQVLPKVTMKKPLLITVRFTSLVSKDIAIKLSCLNVDVSLLHFVEEGDDCFYVTGYNRDGIEFGRYGVNRSTLSRFMSRVLPYPHIPQTLPTDFLPNLNDVDEIEISVNGVLVKFDVFHKEHMGKRLWLNAFNTDGSTLGCDEGLFLEDKGEEFGFDSKDDEVVPKVKEVPLADGVLKGAFGGEGDDDFSLGCDEGLFLEDKGEEFGFDSKDDEVVPKVKEVPLADGVLKGAFGGEGDDDFSLGEGV
nr:hypothetical protein [Tanacetum cinerariifolium]